MMRRIETTAGWLVAQAIGPGHVVALLMKNSPAFLELTFALSHLGAVSLPIDYRLATEEVVSWTTPTPGYCCATRSSPPRPMACCICSTWRR
jgi:acyl-CoA synthetase (AMP-forming)/AMP-acid ligase II